MKKHLIKIYCNQEIPCNPCVDLCSKKAIICDKLTSIPQFKQENCVGCLMCVAGCPGQALYYLDELNSSITFPYEFCERPEIGDNVKLVDEMGEEIGFGIINNYLNKEAYNKTTLVVVNGDIDNLKKTRGIVKG